jgi:predicted NUDIX family NTP pyrophosphohydrolase
VQVSAGLLPYRRIGSLEVLIAHPGGPLFAAKDAGWWSTVKGLVEEGEDDLAAARREFAEETGWTPPAWARYVPLGEVTLKSRKRVRAFAFEGDFEPSTLDPGTFLMKWRGRTQSFPEIDRVVWAAPDEARRLLNAAQSEFVDRLATALAGR